MSRNKTFCNQWTTNIFMNFFSKVFIYCSPLKRYQSIMPDSLQSVVVLKAKRTFLTSSFMRIRRCSARLRSGEFPRRLPSPFFLKKSNVIRSFINKSATKKGKYLCFGHSSFGGHNLYRKVGIIREYLMFDVNTVRFQQE